MLLVKQARLILVSSKEEIKICLSVFLFGNKEGLSVFQIKKILNVNVVLVSKGEHEYIAFGKGIGYHQKVNNMIPESRIAKKFIPIDDSRKSEMIQSLNNVPPIYIDITTKIVEYAENKLHENLLPNIYYSLTDHLYFAVQRYHADQALGNRIYWEMKAYYPEMFDIGVYGLKITNKMLNLHLPREEAANIAFHVINSSTQSTVKTNILDVTQLVDSILQTLRVLTGGNLTSNSLNYDRFVMHLKFFAQRYLSDTMLSDKDDLLKMVYRLYPKASNMSIKIQNTIETIYEKAITNEELAYLIIHIHRVLTD